MQQADLFDLDPSRSQALFSVKHFAGRVRGAFRRFHGTLRFTPADLAATGAVIVVEVASVDTGHARRDRDLRSSAFLAAERYPEIRFESTGTGQVQGNAFELWGELTMHGVTRRLPLHVMFTGVSAGPDGVPYATFEARASVSRREFEMSLNQALEMGGLLVSDRIELTFRITATRRIVS